MKHFINNFPDDLNWDLRAEAHRQHVTLRDLIINILQEYIVRQEIDRREKERRERGKGCVAQDVKLDF